MNEIQEVVFRQKVDDALKAVERILELNRNPQLAQDVDHQYADKYDLVNQMSNTALIGQLNVLSYFGLTADILKSIDKSKPATLRFQASDSCTFLKTQTVEVPMDRSLEEFEQTQTIGSSFFGSTTKSTIKQIIKNIEEFHWKVDVTWEISVYSGSDVGGKKILKSRSSSMILIIQSNKRAPLPENRECKPLDLSISWLMKQIDTERMASKFTIDRQGPKTKTPSQNEEVHAVLSMMSELQQWTSGIRTYFNRYIQQDILDKHNPAGPVPLINQKDRLTSLSCDDIFVPVQPLLETSKAVSENVETLSKSVLSLVSVTTDNDRTLETVSPLLSTNDMHTFLNEQIRCIEERIGTLKKMFPSTSRSTTIVSVAEASIVLLSLHSERLGAALISGVNYVECMLRNQLVAAIGKSVQSSDIDRFLRYHNARLLNPAPNAFCHAIRQPGHDPCGLLSIEGIESDDKKEPIYTLSREIESSNSIKLPLNSATTIELTGKKYLHGWIRHRFGQDQKSYELIARARQFSCFLLVVGTMTGPDTLDPKDAIIIKNKDELLIPLLLNEIPTSREFKDAIRSLSPEQQRFTEAFRGMQLGSSVLGICVIQIKPQLEALLGLPHDALLKEMKLTQDLMELFIEYQVPSDLLSYDGTDASASVKEKVDTVRGHTKAVFDVIGEAKKNQLEEQIQRTDMALERRLEMSTMVRQEQILRRDMPLKSMRYPRNLMQPKSDGQDRLCTKFKSALEVPVGSLDEGETFLGSKSFPCSEEPLGSMELLAEASAPESASDEKFLSDASGSRVQEDKDEDDKESLSETSGSRVPKEKHKESITKQGDLDFTEVPKLLNRAIEKFSDGSALRSTTVKSGNRWQRKRQENLLSIPEEEVLTPDMSLVLERNKAFDLLDAISRSGSLPIAWSELHVVVAVTHCFEKDVINTIIQDNINPIEKLEMSTLLLGAAIHGIPAFQLVKEESQARRLKSFFPLLLVYQEEDE